MRHILTARSFFCPDSATIETHFGCSLFFLSRFCQYRDTLSLLALFSVPILLLSRHTLAVHPFFCPDSATIETYFDCSLFFLSRFPNYRDTLSLLALFSVPILPLSRHTFTAHSFFCPDSATIETYFDCSLFFLSRFCYYRDTLWLFTLFSVPILPLLRHILTARSFFCPDSPTIETHFHCSLFFLSRFCHYRDTLSLLTLFPVPILPLSRHILTARSFFCPDSATIETHFGCSPFFLSRFCHY